MLVIAYEICTEFFDEDTSDYSWIPDEAKRWLFAAVIIGTLGSKLSDVKESFFTSEESATMMIRLV